MIRKLFKNRSGFSLAEVAVAAGALGIVSLGTMQLVKMQNKSTNTLAANTEEMELVKRISSTLANKVACNYTIGGSCSSSAYTSKQACTTNPDGTATGRTWSENPGLAEGNTVPAIKNSANQVVANTSTKKLFGGVTGKETIELTSLKVVKDGASWPTDNTSGMILLEITISRLKSQIFQKSITKHIAVPVKVGDSGKIIECMSEEDSAIETARKKSCEDVGGTWSEENQYCLLASKTDTDTLMDSDGTDSDSAVRKRYVDQGDCQGVGLRWDTSANECRVTYTGTGNLAINCPAGTAPTELKVTINDTPQPHNTTIAPGTAYSYSATCIQVSKSCPTGDIMTGITANGDPICKGAATKSCDSDQIAILTPTGWQCADTCGANEFSNIRYSGNSIDVTCLSCDTGEIGVIDGNGNLKCSTIPSSCTTTTDAAKALQLKSDGEFQCSTVLETTDSAAICPGNQLMWGVKIDGDKKIVPRCCAPDEVYNLSDGSNPACQDPDRQTTKAEICDGQTFPCRGSGGGVDCGNITGTHIITCSDQTTYKKQADKDTVNTRCPSIQVSVHDTYGNTCKTCPGVQHAGKTCDQATTKTEMGLSGYCPNITRYLKDGANNVCLSCLGTKSTNCADYSDQTANSCAGTNVPIYDDHSNLCVYCPGSSPWLYASRYCHKSCTNEGGTVDGSFCKFSGDTCPAGWTLYQVYIPKKTCYGSVPEGGTEYCIYANTWSGCGTKGYKQCATRSSCTTEGDTWYASSVEMVHCHYYGMNTPDCMEWKGGGKKGCRKEWNVIDGDHCKCHDDQASCDNDLTDWSSCRSYPSHVRCY